MLPTMLLYTASDLLDGFNPFDELGFTLTRDFEVFRQFVSDGAPVPSSLETQLEQVRHDATIADAFKRFLKDVGRPLVGFMGGHAAKRNSPAFADIARLAWSIAQVSGPGVWGNQPNYPFILGGVMGQILHGSATTTHAIRAAIQRSKAPLKELAAQHGLNQKTVAKWRKRTFVHDAPMGPKTARSTILTSEQEATVVAFRRHTLLPLDDCLYALQPTIPHLTRSSLHRCLQRHGISRLPEVAGDKPAKQPFKAYPIGYFHIDIAEVRTEEGKLYLFVGVDRTSKYAFARLTKTATHRHRQGLPRRTGGSCPLQNPHRTHRQWHPVR